MRERTNQRDVSWLPSLLCLKYLIKNPASNVVQTQDALLVHRP